MLLLIINLCFQSATSILSIILKFFGIKIIHNINYWKSQFSSSLIFVPPLLFLIPGEYPSVSFIPKAPLHFLEMIIFSCTQLNLDCRSQKISIDETRSR